MTTLSMVPYHRAYTHVCRGDNYTCIAVANIYMATINVQMGLEQYAPYTDGSQCTINLAHYCAPKWKYFRSTRPALPSPFS
jgi:hypothetical protein